MSAEHELAQLERRILEAASVGGFLKAVDELRVMLEREPDSVRKAVLAMIAPKLEREARAALVTAFRLGAADALVIVGDTTPPRYKLSAGARAPVKGIDAAGRGALAMAQRLARSSSAEPFDVLAPLFGYANRVRGSVSDAINMSGNEGTAAVASRAGLPLVWVAEVDACVHCLAYSGRVVKRGESFPGGLTYGKKSYYPTAIKTPPRHPRCRCTLEPLQSQEYADALRREADRSVLRGFSLTSESMSVRVDAAKRLIERGVDAPKSVIAYARRSVKAGKFATRGRPGE